MVDQHRRECIEMAKEYVRWLEKNPEKYNDFIPKQIYWPLIRNKVIEANRFGIEL